MRFNFICAYACKERKLHGENPSLGLFMFSVQCLQVRWKQTILLMNTHNPIVKFQSIQWNAHMFV